MNEVLVGIGAHQAGHGAERQVETVGGVGAQESDAGRESGGPVVGELHGKAIVLEKRAAPELVGEVEGDRRAGIGDRRGGRQVPLPRQPPAFDLDVGGERHQEPARHRVDEGWTLLHRFDLEPQFGADDVGGHVLEPVGQAAAGRHRLGDQPLQFGRTAEDDLHRGRLHVDRTDRGRAWGAPADGAMRRPGTALTAGTISS